jgi:hypothetical protein
VGGVCVKGVVDEHETDEPSQNMIFSFMYGCIYVFLPPSLSYTTLCGREVPVCNVLLRFFQKKKSFVKATRIKNSVTMN